MDIFFILSLITLTAILGIAIETSLGIRKLTPLGDITPANDKDLPMVSVIIPALNEEENIENALQSVLALDYPHFEIIAVNDRSSDSTGSILDQMSQKDTRLQVLHIETLPPGWLGKNHAMYLAARKAAGKYLLFTDADVFMEQSTLKRAVGRMESNKLDHLSLFFNIIPQNGLLSTMIIEFAGALCWMFKPWKASDPQSRRHMGVGAFNLVRSEAYHQSGTHKAIAMCPIDDIVLGRLIKSSGFTQECLAGQDFISVPWYNSVPDMIKGLRKNLYAAFDYNIFKVFAATAILFLAGILPLYALIFAHGKIRIVNSIIILTRILLVSDGAIRLGMNPMISLWILVTPFFNLYLFWHAVFTTIFSGGITWRDTFYSLDELKRKRLK